MTESHLAGAKPKPPPRTAATPRLKDPPKSITICRRDNNERDDIVVTSENNGIHIYTYGSNTFSLYFHTTTTLKCSTSEFDFRYEELE